MKTVADVDEKLAKRSGEICDAIVSLAQSMDWNPNDVAYALSIVAGKVLNTKFHPTDSEPEVRLQRFINSLKASFYETDAAPKID